MYVNLLVNLHPNCTCSPLTSLTKDAPPGTLPKQLRAKKSLPASDLWLLDSAASVSEFQKGFQHSPIQTLVNSFQAANGISVNVDGFCKVLLEIQVVDGRREDKPPKPAVLPVDVVVGNTAYQFCRFANLENRAGIFLVENR